MHSEAMQSAETIDVYKRQVCRDVLELAKSYIGAREAVSYRAIYGASRAVNIREIDPQETAGGNPTDDTRLGELFKRICLGSEQEVREAADRYLAKNSFPAQSLQGHQIAIMELVSGLYRFSANHDISMEAFGKMCIRDRYLAGYGAGRFWIEALRTDQLWIPGTEIPVSQVLAGTLVIVSVVLIIWGRKKQKKVREAQA